MLSCEEGAGGGVLEIGANARSMEGESEGWFWARESCPCLQVPFFGNGRSSQFTSDQWLPSAFICVLLRRTYWLQDFALKQQVLQSPVGAALTSDTPCPHSQPCIFLSISSCFPFFHPPSSAKIALLPNSAQLRTVLLILAHL